MIFEKLHKNPEISDFSSLGREILFLIKNSNSIIKLTLRKSTVCELRKSKIVFYFMKEITTIFFGWA